MKSLDSKLIQTVFAYEKLQRKIQGRSSEEQKVIEYLKEIVSHLRPEAVDKIRAILDSSLMKLYDGINFDVPHDLDLPKLIKENNVIFVLNHQSHADYLIFNYILFVHYKICSFIAGGINLNIFPIGKMFREAGCFFIRRSFQNDILYKLTLEAYLSHLLLNEEYPIEFFFEGGRSRTGKLLPPKFGLFQMLLETHSLVDTKKPLLFVPVSIVHEYVPEQRALTQESRGAQKVQENFFQLISLVKFLSKKFGTLHIKVSHPIEKRGPFEDFKKTTQELAFECFRDVGKGMVVTPSSILAMVLLDGTTGAIELNDICQKARPILDYCETFGVPLAPSLHKEKWQQSLDNNLRLFIQSKKVIIEQREKLGKTFFVVVDSGRIEILYFKNMILHHFLVPFFISSAWQNVMNGSIKDPHELKAFLLEKRKELKYEFYLPTIKELFLHGFEIISDCVGRRIEGLQDCFSLTPKELGLIADRIGPFASSFRSIYEGYYVGAMTLKHMKNDEFSREEYYRVSREVFNMEILHGRFIRYSESYTVPLMKTGLSYFLNQKLLIKKGSTFKVANIEKVEEVVVRYAKDLTDLLLSSLRVPPS